MVESEFDIDTSNLPNPNDINHYEQLYCDGCTKDFNVHFRQSNGNREVSVEGSTDLVFHIEDNFALETDWIIDTPISEHLEIFSSNMQEARRLLEDVGNNAQRPLLIKMLFTQTITILETYLSSVLTHTILNSQSLLRKFVESDKSFSKKKMTFGEIFKAHDNIQKTVAEELNRRVFHNLKAVEAIMDSLGLNIKIGASVYKAVYLRHHFTHRNGYDFDGNPVVIEEADIVSLIKLLITLVADVDTQIAQLSED